MLQQFEIYEKGVISVKRPFKAVIKASPYFIPFEEIDTIVVGGPGNKDYWFIMKDDTIAECSVDGDITNYNHFDPILKAKCPKAQVVGLQYHGSIHGLPLEQLHRSSDGSKRKIFIPD
jgi:hypothetical protein